MDPKMFAIFLFIYYFFREFFFELKVFFIVHQFIFLLKLKQGSDENCTK